MPVFNALSTLAGNVIWRIIRRCFRTFNMGETAMPSAVRSRHYRRRRWQGRLKTDGMTAGLVCGCLASQFGQGSE
jgi:hypothetical protein